MFVAAAAHQRERTFRRWRPPRSRPPRTGTSALLKTNAEAVCNLRWHSMRAFRFTARNSSSDREHTAKTLILQYSRNCIFAMFLLGLDARTSQQAPKSDELAPKANHPRLRVISANMPSRNKAERTAAPLIPQKNLLSIICAGPQPHVEGAIFGEKVPRQYSAKALHMRLSCLSANNPVTRRTLPAIPAAPVCKLRRAAQDRALRCFSSAVAYLSTSANRMRRRFITFSSKDPYSRHPMPLVGYIGIQLHFV